MHTAASKIGRVAKYLAVGAVVNVAAAWACALWGPIPGNVSYDRRIDFEKPSSEVRRLVPQSRMPLVSERPECSGLEEHYLGAGVRLVLITMDRDGPGGPAINRGKCDFGVLNCRAGWPFASMESTYQAPDWPPGDYWSGQPGEVWTGGCAAPSWLGPRTSDTYSFGAPGRSLPFRPIVFGTVFNTAVYGVVIFGSVATIRAARSSSRARRGLCTRCAYPITGLTVCSECGQAVRASRVSAPNPS